MTRAVTSIMATPPDSEDNLERLGGNVKRLFSAVNNLTHHGIDAIADISVPKIALVGDQSAGKSSLVEALSQIQVPRDAGTCTRCPMEITVEGADSGWSATVSLLKTHSYDPGSEKDENEFWPWIAGTEAVKPTEFKTIDDKGELEDVLRLAQRAILTPSRQALDFLSAGQDTLQEIRTQMPFSPNVVVVKIRGQGLPNLSFIDLPGVISQSDEGGSRMVHLVKQLARTYIQQSNTLVLLACSMENDIMNSAASGLINEEEANDRCIGVLTKPDRLAQGAESAIQWKEVLDGVKFKRGLGYFVTKQPGQQGPKDITYDEARAQELAFFNSRQWQDLLPGYEHQLGTNKLAEALSEHLVSLIELQLPIIRAKVVEKLEEINILLEGMPAPPLNPFHEVHRIVRDYGLSINAMISNDPPDNILRQICVAEMNTFQEVVLESLRPKFLPYTDLDPTKRKATTELPLRQGSTDPMTPKRSRTDAKIKAEPTKKSRADLNIKVESPYRSPSRSNQSLTPVSSRRANGTSPRKQTVNSDEAFTCLGLKLEIDKYEVPGVPGEVNPDGLNKLILGTVQNWHSPIEKLLQTLGHAVRNQLMQVIGLNDICGGYKGSPLLKHMENFTSNFVRDFILSEKDKALEAAQREGLRPVIVDQAHFEAEKDKEYTVLKELRLIRRAQHFAGTHGDDLDPKSDQDKKKLEALITKKSNGRDFGPDPYDREVQVVAKIKAYYRIASTRLTENVSMIVEAGILHRLRSLSQDLETNLNLHGGLSTHHWAGMLEQDAQVAEERMRLTAQAAALQAAFEELEQVTGGNGYEMDLEVDGAI